MTANRPFWDENPFVASWEGLPPLPGDTTADVCVIGLGGSGLAAVAAAVEHGLSVVGVDAGRVAGRAAGRNGGFLIAGPEDPLHTSIELWGEEAAVSLYRDTLAEIDRLASLLGPRVVRRTGSIRLAGLPGDPLDEDEAADRQRDVADCALQAAAMRAHGIAVQEYGGDLGSGLFLPDDAAVNPARRVLGEVLAVAGSAVLHEQTRVTAIEAGRVTTERGVISAAAVVVAADGKLEALLPQLVGRIRTARLQMVATAPVAAARLPCPVYGRWGYDYAQQDPSGVIAIGGGRDRFAEDEWTHQDTPSEPIQQYLDGVAARFAGEPVGITHRWAASVGFTEDGRPLCAQVEDGVVAAGGYNGTGNLVGPLTARAALALALDGTPPPSYLQA
ncbi:MAG TPA: FAD-binding oxidoreductase [Jatrophihabitans sp.]|jgi:glycine/D-amino acid oxidase-like deaminating enzyme